MKNEFNEKLEKLDKKIEKNFQNVRKDLDWQFEITTRSIIRNERGEIFSRCRKINYFKDFKNYFFEICTSGMKDKLYEYSFNLENSLKDLSQKEDNKINRNVNLDKKFYI